MKKTPKKLKINKMTVRLLAAEELKRIVGGKKSHVSST
jgi:hypothetical protein